MKGFRTYRIVVITILTAFAVSTYGTEIADNQPQYNTVAHEILKLESEVMGGIPNYELLDAIINDVKVRITEPPPYSQKKAVIILQQIAEVLAQKNIQVGDAMLLSETCRLRNAEDPHIADCDTLSFLYLAIGEALHLPLRLVNLPEHTFIRWHFSGDTYLNWETTANAVWTDANYVSWYNSTHVHPLIPEHDLRSVEKLEIFAIARYNLGNALTQQGRYNEALEQYSLSITLNPHYLNAYYQRGNMWYAKGRNDEAIADFTHVIRNTPRDVNALQNRGSAWNSKGEYEKAIADFSRALELDPNNVDALYNRGNAWLLDGNNEKALVDFTRVIELNPEDAEAFSYRGSIWSRKGEHEKASADFSNAVALDPWSAEINNAMAWFLATCPEEQYRNGQKAISLAQRALARRPALRMIYLDTLAAAYAEAGDFEKAVSMQESSIRLVTSADGGNAVPSSLVEEYTKRLELYKSQKPYRDLGQQEEKPLML